MSGTCTSQSLWLFYDCDKVTRQQISLHFPDRPELGWQACHGKKHLGWESLFIPSPWLKSFNGFLFAMGHEPSSLAQNPRHAVSK